MIMVIRAWFKKIVHCVYHHVTTETKLLAQTCRADDVRLK